VSVASAQQGAQQRPPSGSAPAGAGAASGATPSRQDTLLPPSAAPANAPAAPPPVVAPSSDRADAQRLGNGGDAPRLGTGGDSPRLGTGGDSPRLVDPQSSAPIRISSDATPSANTNGEIGAKPTDVYSEDWWAHTRPILEIHGYFRTRAELFHNFTLGRHDLPTDPTNPGLWAQPLDNSYTDPTGQTHTVQLCGGLNAQGVPSQSCGQKSQASANMRFRMEPELHISDNLRIVSQIDALDNLVLGSTPNAYAMTPNKAGGYTNAGGNNQAPLGFYSTTQGPPTAGVNGYQNSINVKRAWAEYMTPVGQLRFGRMPDHWGLGMVHNAGDGIDSDWQSTTDRIMFVSGLRSMDLYFGGSWDFVSTGPTSATPYSVYGGQPFDTSQYSNVAQYSVFVARRANPDLQRLQLARGDFVVNGGIYGQYRSQWLDVASPNIPQTVDPNATNVTNNGQEARQAWVVTPDAWVQVLWQKLRIEAEFAGAIGQIGGSPQSTNLANAVGIREFGLATQTEYRAIEDKLHLQMGFGWASGDPWASTLSNGNSTGARTELNGGQGPISTFAFHPDYRVDLILFRNILTQVEGAYYFRPSVDYDFLRHTDGQKLGGGAALIWSRASEFMQAPGHKRDLGVELDLQIYYQAKDGSLNDNPDKLGGFYAALQYGVLFPLAGLGYPSNQPNTNVSLDTSAAQTVRLFLGVAY
jgi:uncharacterized protein (TIGR04551 family)